MKQKTVKSANKRISKTGSGKLMRRNLSAQHLVSGKSKRTRSSARRKSIVNSKDVHKLKKLIPYK